MYDKYNWKNNEISIVLSVTIKLSSGYVELLLKISN